MNLVQRAALVQALRLERKASFDDQRRSNNFVDAGGAGTPMRGSGTAFRIHRDFNHTWNRMLGATRRQLRRGGINRHRAAIRGANGLHYAVNGPNARQLRNGEL